MSIARYLLMEVLAGIAGSRWAARRANRKSPAPAPDPKRLLGATPWDMLIAAFASTQRTLRFIAITFTVLGMTALIAWVLYR